AIPDSQARALSQAEKPDEVEVALAAVGTGTAAEMSRHLITERITVFNDEHRAQAVSALSELTHQRRIIQGRLFRRVDAIFQQVLELHERSGKLELFLFQDEIPTATL